MEKINCIEDYYSSVKAYYLFLTTDAFQNEEWQNYILNDNYLNGAKVCFISNLLLNIKEDIVEKLGYKDFSSNILNNGLEKSIDMIATKTQQGYKLNKKVFKTPADIVAFLRNKFAHGKYIIDFNHNRVIFNDNGSSVIVNIDKLTSFIISASLNYLKYEKKSEISRNVLVLNYSNNKLNRITTASELRGIIKKYKLVKFNLKNNNDEAINLNCIELFEEFLKVYKVNPDGALKSNLYKKLNKILKQNNVTLSNEEKSIKNKSDILELEEFFKNEVMGAQGLNYYDELEIIGKKIERKLCFDDYLKVDSSLKHLLILDAISKTKLSNITAIQNYLYNKNINVGMLYEGIGEIYLSMINTLFVYPFDDVYQGTRDYRKVTSDDFDFSKLDLSLINVSDIDIFSNTINEKEVICNGLLKRKEQTEKNIETQKNNLKELKKKNKDTSSLELIIDSMKKTLKQQSKSLKEELKNYNEMKEYFNSNYDYFKNRRIVEGIRNSIEYGNYKLISKTNSLDTVIEFSDIYDDKLTFKGTITFRDLETLLDNNFEIVKNFINKDKKETVVAKR